MQVADEAKALARLAWVRDPILIDGGVSRNWLGRRRFLCDGLLLRSTTVSNGLLAKRMLTEE